MPAPSLYPIKSIYQYSRAGASTKLFVATDSGIYDATAGGVLGAVVQPLSNGYWNAVSYTNSAGTTYLWGLNGTDTVKAFDGTTWSGPVVTGVSTDTCDNPFIFKRRIFFIKGMSLWYLAVDALAGAATEYPVGALFKRGGYLMAGTSWTVDGGDGIDDLMALITSEGEVAIYKGTDIASATTWALVGVYYLGRPLGRRCFARLGGDVAVLTEGGCLTLSRALSSSIINYSQAITDLIRPTYLSAARNYGAVQGWEICVYPLQNALLINVPTVGQFVMNTATGAWCTFTGWSTISCMCLWNGVLFGGDSVGTVRQLWNTLSYSDQARLAGSRADIVATAQTSFNYLGRSKGLIKPTMFRPQLAYEDLLEVRWGMSVDFSYPKINSVNLRSGVVSSAIWDVSPWDTTPWPTSELQRQKTWRTVSVPPGYAFSLLLQIATSSGSVAWSGTDFQALSGGAM
jgi:hypothetical protein